MTFIEAFASIFVGLWQFLTAPFIMAICGVLIAFLATTLFLYALFSPVSEFRSGWEKAGWSVGSALAALAGLAMAIWATSSSSDGFTWS